jgi:immunoglobulin-binding protein 1
MSESGELDLDNETLSNLFDAGWSMQRELEKSSDEKSSKYLTDRKKAIEIFQKCQYLIDELHLFSTNESIEELSDTEIR